MWQADGTGPEPAAVGHTFTTPLEPITAHYYIASRDYVDPSARGGLQAHALTGFARFADALARAGYAPHDLVLKLPLVTPGADREGQDWWYRDGVETRRLQLHGPVRLELAGQAFMDFPIALLTLTEDYRGARDFADVRLSLVSDPFVPAADPAEQQSALRPLAHALRADLDGAALRVAAESIVLLAQTFAGRGRTSGRFGDIPAAWVEVVENR